MTAAVDQSPACTILLAVASAGDLSTAPTPLLGTRPAVPFQTRRKKEHLLVIERDIARHAPSQATQRHLVYPNPTGS